MHTILPGYAFTYFQLGNDVMTCCIVRVTKTISCVF